MPPKAPEPSKTSFRASIGGDSGSGRSATVKVDRIGELKGESNYNIWSETMKAVWRAMKVYEIVVEGQTPTDDDEDEKHAYEIRCAQAITTLVQGV